MNKTLEKYLNSVDKYLKPLPALERADIIKEIESSILEMENDRLSDQQILDRLGSPRDLAKAYLGDLLTAKKGFSWSKFLTACAFYSVVGFSGIVILPVLVIVAPTFIVCGAATPILGFVKLAASLFGYDMPYIMFQLGPSITFSPAGEFICSIFAGALLIAVGVGAWKLLIHYIKAVSKTKRHLSV